EARRSRVKQAALVIALVGMAPPIARADPESDLGLSPRAAALGGAVSATGGEPASSAYNPAALIVPSDEDGFGHLSVSFVASAPAVYADSLDPTRTLALAPPPNTYAVVAGARFDVGRGLGVPGLALGVALYAPLEGLV